MLELNPTESAPGTSMAIFICIGNKAPAEGAGIRKYYYLAARHYVFNTNERQDLAHRKVVSNV